MRDLTAIGSVILLFSVSSDQKRQRGLLRRLCKLFFSLTPVPAIPGTTGLCLLRVNRALISRTSSVSSGVITFLIRGLKSNHTRARGFTARLVQSYTSGLRPTLKLCFGSGIVRFAKRTPRASGSQGGLRLLGRLRIRVIRIKGITPSTLTDIVPRFRRRFRTSSVSVHLVSVTRLANLFTITGRRAVGVCPRL